MEMLKDILYILITAAVPVLTTYICKFLYAKWTEGTEWSDALTTRRSPKDFFFPQTENLMKFKKNGDL